MSYSNAIWKYISYDFFFQIDLFSVTVQFLMFYSFSCVMKKKFKAWFMSLRNTLSLASIFGLCFPNLFKVNIRRMPTFTHGEIYFALSHLRYARRDMYLESYIFRWKHYILRQLPSFTYLFPTEYIISIEKYRHLYLSITSQVCFQNWLKKTSPINDQS